MSRHRVRLHGLTIDAPFPLDGPVGDPGARADLTFSLGAPQLVPDHVPAGQVWALLHDSRTVRQVLVAVDGGWLLRMPGVLDVRIASSLDRVEVLADPSLSDGYLPILATGAVVATVLQLRDELVLHASAVDVGVDGDDVVALVGPSGAGKSTTATLLCSGGAQLVSDDVLRVDVRPEIVSAWRGPATSRLRETASVLAHGRPSTTSADGRTVLTHEHSAHDRVRLRGILLPRPDREGDDVRVVRLDGARALLPLLAAPRVLGWCHPASLAVQLEKLGRLAAALPVAEIHLPWGPPFPTGLGGDAVEALRLAQVVGGAAGSSTA